jgi:hypothetical protein
LRYYSSQKNPDNPSYDKNNYRNDKLWNKAGNAKPNVLERARKHVTPLFKYHNDNKSIKQAVSSLIILPGLIFWQLN